MLILRVRYRFFVTARHGAAGAPRCATWYMVRAGQRAIHVASLIEAFMALNTANFSLMLAIHSIESPRTPTFPSFLSLIERTLNYCVIDSSSLKYPYSTYLIR